MKTIKESIHLCQTIIGPTFVEMDKAILHEIVLELHKQNYFVVQIDTTPVQDFDDLFNIFL